MTRRAIFRDGAATRDSFFRGAAAAFKAPGVVRRYPGLARYFIIPFFLNVVILTALFYLAYTQLYGPLSGLVEGTAWYNRVLEFVLTPILVIVLGIIIVLCYSIIGTVITAPFNDFLSEKVEAALTGERSDEPFRLMVFIRDMLRILANIIKLLLIIILINILLLMVNLIPAAGSVMYVVLGFLSTSFFLGFQFFDFPLERRRLQFRDKLSVAWRYKRTVTGVGVSFFFMTFVPVIGFLGLNIATVAATKIFVEEIRPALAPRPRPGEPR